MYKQGKGVGEEYTKIGKIDVMIDWNEIIQSESTLHNIIQYVYNVKNQIDNA